MEPWQSRPCHTRPHSLKKKICLEQLLYGFETQVSWFNGPSTASRHYPRCCTEMADTANASLLQQSPSPEVLLTAKPHPREGGFHSQGSSLIVGTTYRRACYSLLCARAGQLRQNNLLISTKDNISQFMPKTLCNLRQASEDAIFVVLLLIC